jgi:uncharacterized membrane protein YsdA (DUF1294 family)/cold shock CspA family protein
MAKGKIVHWKAERGFGFIRPRDGGGNVFLHIGDIRHDGYEPQIGDDVSYSLKKDAHGRPRAAGVVVAGVGRSRREWFVALAALVPAGFLLALYGMEAYRPALFAYLGMSMVTFVAYGIDKRSARTGGWRTPEARLHLFGLLGGWPGAIPAQLLFRHKTRKPSFQFVFWMIVAVHIGFWGWLQITGLSPDELIRQGRGFADSILR